MFIKVLKCSNSEYWYNSHMGKVFEPIKYDNDSQSYIIDDIDGTKTMMGSIFLEDCEEVVEFNEVDLFVRPIPPKSKEEILQETLDILILSTL